MRMMQYHRSRVSANWKNSNGRRAHSFAGMLHGRAHRFMIKNGRISQTLFDKANRATGIANMVRPVPYSMM